MFISANVDLSWVQMNYSYLERSGLVCLLYFSSLSCSSRYRSMRSFMDWNYSSIAFFSCCTLCRMFFSYSFSSRSEAVSSVASFFTDDW